MTDEIVPAEKPDFRRHLRLTQAERQALKEQEKVELLVSLFLDLEQDRTNQQISEEAGMSLASMKRLTQDVRFKELYDEVLMNLGHHPRLQVMNANLPELGVKAYRAIGQILDNPRASATARVAAAKLVWDTLHISDLRIEEDPGPLRNFMQGAGLNVQGSGNTINVNIPIPDEYKAAFARLLGATPQIIDVPAQDVPE